MNHDHLRHDASADNPLDAAFHADLAARLDRVVSDLHAPDVLARVVADGRRQRAYRRTLTGAGSIAAAAVLTVAGVAIFDGGSSGAPARAADPAATSASPSAPTPTSSPSPSSPSVAEECGSDSPGWWRMSQQDIVARLRAALPAGVRLGTVDRRLAGADGIWAGALEQGSDTGFLQFELLPPPGVPGALIPLQAALEQTAEAGACAGLRNAPAEAVRACDDSARPAEACEEIRDESGELVGIVTRRIDDSGNGFTAQAVRATMAVPGGGYVQLYVSTGNPADSPDTPRDPDEVPALTLAQARAIVADPAWTP